MTPANLGFYVSLNPLVKEPLYKQLSDQIRDSILCGRLKSGELLPATRNLAQDLGLSRFTVVESYRKLHSQGYVQADRGIGSRVSCSLPDFSLSTISSNEAVSFEPQINGDLSAYAKRLLTLETAARSACNNGCQIDFNCKDPANLPLKEWCQSIATLSKNKDNAILEYCSDPQGYLPLREAIAAYVSRSRSVKASSNQIVIFSSYHAALACISRILINAGDQVFVERPGSIGAARVLRYQGAQILSIPTDEEGMRTSVLRESGERPKLIFSTPSVQFATGGALSLQRRIELLEYAKQRNVYIIEDDYDSEYRYGKKGAPALQSIDKAGCVIYLNTFAKLLHPLTDLAFLVLPNELVPVVNIVKSATETALPMIEQCILADWIETGSLERHIIKTQSIYNKQRRALLQAIVKNFGSNVDVVRERSGTHFLVRFLFPLSDLEILQCANACKIHLTSTCGAYPNELGVNGEFIWSFANRVDDVQKNVATFAQLITEEFPKIN